MYIHIILLTLGLSLFDNLNSRIVGKVHLSNGIKNIYLFSDTHLLEDDMNQFEYLKENVLKSKIKKKLTILVEAYPDPELLKSLDETIYDESTLSQLNKTLLRSFMNYIGKNSDVFLIKGIDLRDYIDVFTSFTSLFLKYLRGVELPEKQLAYIKKTEILFANTTFNDLIYNNYLNYIDSLSNETVDKNVLKWINKKKIQIIKHAKSLRETFFEFVEFHIKEPVERIDLDGFSILTGLKNISKKYWENPSIENLKKEGTHALLSIFMGIYLSRKDIEYSDIVDIIGIIEALNSKNDVAIFAGLNHTDSIMKKLIKNDFEIISQEGITTIQQRDIILRDNSIELQGFTQESMRKIEPSFPPIDNQAFDCLKGNLFDFFLIYWKLFTKRFNFYFKFF